MNFLPVGRIQVKKAVAEELTTPALAEENRWIEKYLESGDQQGLACLYEKYKKQIFLLCLKVTGNAEEAKDLASEAFIKAFDRLEQFNPHRPFSPWLCRIATNLCIDHLRKRSRIRFQEIEDDHAVTCIEQVEASAKQGDLKRKIFEALQRLKPPQRRCFCLFYLHNRSYQEIVEITGYSFEQVRSHIQNGRRRFKILMEKNQ